MSVTSAPRARMAVNASWPGRVDEGDPAAVLLDLVGADLLGDPAGLAGGDGGLADGVEQRGLAVVDVAEHGDHRRSRHQRRRVGARLVEEWVAPPDRGRGGSGRSLLALGLEPEVIGGQRGGVEVDRLVEGGHDAVAHQVLDELRSGDRQAFGELLDRHRGRQRELLHRGDGWTSCLSASRAGAQFLVVDDIFPDPQGTRQCPPAPCLRQAVAAVRAEVGSPAGKLVASIKSNLSAASEGEPDQLGPAPHPPAADAAALGHVGAHPACSAATTSIRQPHSRATSRALSPPLPMARESWSGSAVTLAVRVASSRSTLRTVAGASALAM